jgi:hypothetical protein
MALSISETRSERKRSQGVQRTPTNVSFYMAPRTRRTLAFKEKFNVWLINEAYEGARQISSVHGYIFLHLPVVVFGFLNYELSDDLVDARTTFGITYCALFLFIPNKSHLFFQLLLDQQHLFFMSMSPLSRFQSVVTLSLFYDGRLQV